MKNIKEFNKILELDKICRLKNYQVTNLEQLPLVGNRCFNLLWFFLIIQKKTALNII